MNDSVHIRPAGEADIEAMAGLLSELFAIEADFHFDAERQGRGLALLLGPTSTAEVLVAEIEGRIVGMCTMQRLVSTAEGGWAGLIEDVVVARGYRRHGVGGRLLAAMEARAVSLGIGRLQLLADRTNVPALDFYAAAGWGPTSLRALRRYP